VVVQPVRFTDNIEPMGSFLELLGLVRKVESERGGWLVLAGGGGMVALHAAAFSDSGGKQGTTLSFEADDLDTVAAALTAAGAPEVTIYDEAYGRVLTCRDPLGDPITVNEVMADMYGYRSVAGDKPAAPKVLPVRFCDPAGPYGPFLEALGLAPRGPVSAYFTSYAADGGEHGLVGLHYVFGDERPVVPGRSAVQLTFESGEPLADIATRLAGAGFDPAIRPESFGSVLVVTDPDGQEVQVHTPPAAHS
jgi:predicted enzyme related to lactoylglutathione lyase